MGIFETAENIVTTAVRDRDINLRELQSTPEGQSACYIYDMACKQVCRNLRLSINTEVVETHEKSVRQVLGAYRKLTLDRWKPTPSDKTRVMTRYNTKQEADVAADVLALCGVTCKKEDNMSLSISLTDHVRWAKQETQARTNT